MAMRGAQWMMRTIPQELLTSSPIESSNGSVDSDFLQALSDSIHECVEWLKVRPEPIAQSEHGKSML